MDEVNKEPLLETHYGNPNPIVDSVLSARMDGNGSVMKNVDQNDKLQVDQNILLITNSYLPAIRFMSDAMTSSHVDAIFQVQLL